VLKFKMSSFGIFSFIRGLILSWYVLHRAVFVAWTGSTWPNAGNICIQITLSYIKLINLPYVLATSLVWHGSRWRIRRATCMRRICTL
jgi:hypothetical protein